MSQPPDEYGTNGPSSGHPAAPDGSVPPRDQLVPPGSWGQPAPWAPPNPWGSSNPGGQPPQWGQPMQGGQPPQWGQPMQGVPGGFGGYVAPPKPGVIPLRPLGLGEMLDGAFQACRKNAASTFGSAVLVQVLLSLLTLALLGSLLLAPGQLETLSTADDSEALGWAASVLGGASVVSVLTVAAVLILQGVLVIPVARAILNLKTGFAQMWRIAGRRILLLVGLGLLLMVGIVVILVSFVLLMVAVVAALKEASIAIVILCVLALAAAGAWIAVKLSLAPAALILDGTGIFASLGRSWTLIKGNWWRTFGILLLTNLIVQVIVNVVTAPITIIVSLVFSSSAGSATGEDALLASVPLLLATSLITAVFAAVGMAFQAGVTSLLYVDLRIRREGFDITLMKEHETAATSSSDFLPGNSLRGAGRAATASRSEPPNPWQHP